MPINVLTTSGEDFYVYDQGMSLKDFLEEYYDTDSDYIEVLVWKQDSKTYPAAIMKDQIISIRDLLVETMEAQNYNIPKY